jgi:hypothetical protein
MKRNLIIIAVGIIILILLALYLPPSQVMAPDTDTSVDTSGQTVQPAMPSDQGGTGDATGGSDLTFAYPNALTTTYITSNNWPPQVQVTQTPYSCTPSGTQIGPNGQTVERTINSNVYCVTTASEGTAGSTDKTFTYDTMMGIDNINISFTLQYPDCSNYDGAKMTACKAEESSFDVDGLVDSIVQSATPISPN